MKRGIRPRKTLFPLLASKASSRCMRSRDEQERYDLLMAALKAGKMDMDFVAQTVGTLSNIDAEDIWYPGKTK